MCQKDIYALSPIEENHIDRTKEDFCCSKTPPVEVRAMKQDSCCSVGVTVAEDTIEDSSTSLKGISNIKAPTQGASSALQTGYEVGRAVGIDSYALQPTKLIEGAEKKLSCCSKDAIAGGERHPQTYKGCSSKEDGCYDVPAASELSCCSKIPKNGCCSARRSTLQKIGDFNIGKSPKSDDLEDEDDATLCDCCIVVALDRQDSDVGAVVVSERGSIEDRLRRCCRIFRGNVTSRKACCFKVEPSQRRKNRVEMRGNVGTEAGQVVNSSLTESERIRQIGESSRETLRLRVIGMDCAECAPNVARALKQLPSVQPVSLDYFRGTAELTYEVEVIHASAIVHFVARATGFSIEAMSSSGHTDDADNVTLPFIFGGVIPDEVLSKYNVVKRKQPPNAFDISFPIQGAKGKLPRDIAADILMYNGRLVPLAEIQPKDNAAIDAQRVGLRCLISVVLCIPTLIFAWATLPGNQVRWTAATLGLCSLIFLNASPLMAPSLRSLVYLRRIDLIFLVTVSITISYVFSVVSFGLQQAGINVSAPFFETVALLVTLIYCGRTVQAYTRLSVATSANAVGKIQSPTVLLYGDGGDKGAGVDRQQELDARLLHYGDRLIVKPDTLFPTDCIVLSGSGGIDESSFTGESVPVIKSEGSIIMAGTRNLDGHFMVQVTHLIHENSLSVMRETIFKAQSSRSKFQDLADRLAAIIFPLAVISAVLAFLIWALLERFVRHSSSSSSGIKGLEYAIAIVVVSCPCALGLAIPLVSSAGMRIGLSEGILFRSGEALHRTRGITLFAFDKTGTLSKGDFKVQEEILYISGARRLAAALTRDNGHPIAKSVAVATLHAPFIDLEDVTNIPGNGIKATYRAFPVRGGSASFCGYSEHEAVLRFTDAGLSVFVVTIGNRLGAVYGLMDEPRQESQAMISELHRQGLKTAIISGDNDGAVKKFADMVGVRTTEVWSACSPKAKADIVEEYRRQGHKVCFVGDGVNDSIAFASADISFSLVSGSEIAIASSDVLLLGSNLRQSIFQALAVANITYRHSILGLAWCSLYAVAAIVLASGILVDFHIAPRWAGLGEVVSVVPVVLIGLSMFVLWSRNSMR